jgi:hypothetical protein
MHYAIAAIVLIQVRDENGTGHDPNLKVVGWGSVTFVLERSSGTALMRDVGPAPPASETAPKSPSAER